MDNDVKLLAVYEDLLRKIEEVMKMTGPAGADGRDGKDGVSTDPTAKVMAAMGTLHSDLLKQLISAEREVVVNPQVTVNTATYDFDIQRDNRGLINRVQAKPTTNDGF